MELAERLNNIMQAIDPYEYRDSEYSYEQAQEDLKKPYIVIDALLTILEDMI